MQSPDDPQLGDYLDRWLERRRPQLRPWSVKSYRTCINSYLRPHLGEVRLVGLDRRMIERVYARLLAAGGRDGQPLAVGTVNVVHKVLRMALNDAQIDGLLEQNPAAAARPPTRDPNAIEVDDSLRIWTFDQAARFLQQVADHRWRPLWHLAIGTGARRGELLGLRWDDVDLDTATVTIRRALTVVDRTARLLNTKASQTRVLALGPSVVEEMERRSHQQADHREQAGEDWMDAWGLVFTRPSGKHLHPDVVSREFRQLVRTLDVPVLRLHDLRHTHASLLLALGVAAKVVSDRLGHASITTTLDTYAHLLPAMDRDAADTFAEILRNADA